MIDDHIARQNRRNLRYFEADSMRELNDHMVGWQEKENQRLQSITIQKDAGKFCCIALTNPAEMVIVDPRSHNMQASVNNNGSLSMVIVDSHNRQASVNNNGSLGVGIVGRSGTTAEVTYSGKLNVDDS